MNNGLDYKLGEIAKNLGKLQPPTRDKSEVFVFQSRRYRVRIYHSERPGQIFNLVDINGKESYISRSGDGKNFNVERNDSQELKLLIDKIMPDVAREKAQLRLF